MPDANDVSFGVDDKHGWDRSDPVLAGNLQGLIAHQVSPLDLVLIEVFFHGF